MIQRNFASKEDINSIKDDVHKLATKDEMNSRFGELKSEVREVRYDLSEVKIKLDYVQEIVKRIDEKDLPNLKRKVTILEKNQKTI